MQGALDSAVLAVAREVERVTDAHEWASDVLDVWAEVERRHGCDTYTGVRFLVTFGGPTVEVGVSLSSPDLFTVTGSWGSARASAACCSPTLGQWCREHVEGYENM